jgi:hypothetical protein
MELLLSDDKMDFSSGSSDLYELSEDESDINSTIVQGEKDSMIGIKMEEKHKETSDS